MVIEAWRRFAIGISMGILSICIAHATAKDSIERVDSLARLSTIERIFGKGGIKFKLRGTTALGVSLRNRSVDNPLLLPQDRKATSFSFDQQINTSLDANWGERLSLHMGYNTSATLPQDSRSVKLSYNGQKGELLRLVEVGNLSFKPSNSLIQYGSSLFGIRTRWEYGPLRLDLVASHQKSQRQTIQVKRGRQTQSFNLKASEYDQRRHFFLSDFFRSQYEKALKQLPQLRSEVHIRRIEVWVTNRNSNYEQARSLLAFSDLGEQKRIYNPKIKIKGLNVPDNEANTLFDELSSLGVDKNNSITLSSDFSSGLDYESITSARPLLPSEYYLNPSLGFISLQRPLATDEVLAVAYEYTYQGRTYRVGTLSNNRRATDRLIVKLLHGTNSTPNSPHWHYMMRNVYSIGGTQLEPNSLDLDILYYSTNSSIQTPYLQEEQKISNIRLLQLLGLDNNSTNNSGRPDGHFDFYEGITVHAEWGLIYLPLVEPFGNSLDSILNSNSIQKKYTYPELYNGSPKDIQEHKEQDRFLISGIYKGNNYTNNQDLQLGKALKDGSVFVRHAGRELTEGVDYITDYQSGQMEIINPQILASNQAVEISVDETRNPSSMRRTIVGADLVYSPSDELQIGASIMHLSELSNQNLSSLGAEELNNTLWGSNLQYKRQLPSLQRLLNNLPISRQTSPVSMAVVAEFAKLRTGSSSKNQTEGYIDDFDYAMSPIELIHPAPWHLASKPTDLDNSTHSDIHTATKATAGRAHLSWYRIDPLFTRQYNNLTPSYIRNNPQYISHHYVREVEVRELYPLQASELTDVNYLPTLNISYYPDERGPYNLETNRLQADGRLAQPEQSWAGIMRSITQSDFEQSGIEYLEFWLMDPFVYPTNNKRGHLSIHLGEISEDILPDGQLFYEQGLGIGATTYTDWGSVPTSPPVSRSFDQDPILRRKQDVGLNGISSEQEQIHPTYRNYLKNIRTKVSRNQLNIWEEENHNPLKDPAGDDFRHYRDQLYDELEYPILERYKFYNGTEGNSSQISSTNEMNNLVAQITPDSEDINLDNNLNHSNRYYTYEIELSPEHLQVGVGYIVNKRRAEVVLPNGELSFIDWYLYRIPIRSYTNAIGGIQGFRSMRFMRIILSQFAHKQHLRFGSLRLVRGAWQVYQRSLSYESSSDQGTLSISSIGLEEQGDRSPINYVSPPGRGHIQMFTNSGAKIANEQALALQIEGLSHGSSRAIYKPIKHDMRQYQYLELRAHAEKLGLSAEPTAGALELFVRLGSDMQNNYYEYSIPLHLTPERQYSLYSEIDRLAVWPQENTMLIPLDALTKLKSIRNQQSSATIEYSTTAPNHSGAMIRLRGTPSLGDIQIIMIGIRNTSTEEVSAEIWLNDLRLSGRRDSGGWGANARLSLGLSEIGNITFGTRFTSSGFGSLEQGLYERQQESIQQTHLSTTLDLGKLLPERVKLSIPLQYSSYQEEATPLYDPIQTDILMSQTLEAYHNSHARDSVLHQSKRIQNSQSLAITGAKLNIRSKQPMPYDPSNISLTYIYNHTKSSSERLSHEYQQDWQLGLNYDYTPAFKGIKPFSRLSTKGAVSSYLQQYSFKLWPDKLLLYSTIFRSYQEEYNRTFLRTTNESLPSSLSQTFLWNRGVNSTWRLTPNLTAILNMGTDARIEEPYGQVNKVMNSEGYIVWRDKVLHSIAKLGTPMRYRQSSTLTYSLPTGQFKYLNWISGQAAYHANYEWDRGIALSNGEDELPARISNQASLDMHLNLKLSSLYIKSKKLRLVERRFSSHTTKDADTSYPYSRLLYSLMMIRDVQLSYRQSRQTLLPHFSPIIGSWGGQSTSYSGLAPGIPFALGLTNESYIQKAKERGWIGDIEQYQEPAVYTRTLTLETKATLRPLAGLHIYLNNLYTHTERSEHLYISGENSIQKGGNIMMTTIGLNGFWEKVSTKNKYNGKSYIALQSAISDLQEQNTPQGKYIDAFRRVYEGRNTNPKNSTTTYLPNILSSLPNWRITYTSKQSKRILGIKLRSLTLSHTYRGIYRVNNYFQQGSSSSSPYDIGSVSLQESFFPLLGIELALEKGLSLSTQWRKHRALTFTPSHLRLIESQSSEISIGLAYRLSNIRGLWKDTQSDQKQSGGLTFRGEWSHKDNLHLIRQLAIGSSTATRGSLENRFSINLEYDLSRMISLKAFYDWNRILPRVSQARYPTYIKEYGLSLRLTLGE